MSFIAFLNVTPVYSQSVHYGKMTGKILLESGEALPGATVEIKSDALISGLRTTVSNSNGTFVFLSLPVGKYTINATLQGFKKVSQKGMLVSAGSVVTVNLIMQQGRIEEEVIVTAAAPVVDVRTSTVDTKLNKDMLEKLPTSRDPFYDLSLTTPGMFEVGQSASWLPSPAAYGGATNENIFLVNGVNTTNPRGASWGSLVKVNYNAVEEVRVISLGSKAEYGSFSGVAIDVLTKSGSNKLHGNVGLFSMLGKPSDNAPDSTTDLGKDFLYVAETDNIFTNSEEDWEANFTLGGPLVRNKVWFYTGFDFIKSRTHEPNFEPTKNYTGRYFDAKVTTEPARNHRMWLAYHFESNQSDNTSWGSLDWDTSAVYTTKTINHTISAQWQWYIASTSTFSAKYLGFWTDDNPEIPSDAPANPAYINWWKYLPQNCGVNGSFHYIEAQKSSRNTVQADVSHYAEDFLGEHDIKFGVQFTRGRGNWFGGYFHGYANYAYPQRWTNNITYMQNWYGDTGLKMYVRSPERNPYLSIRTSDSLGLFFDDQWTIGDKLTLNIGFRYDRMTSKFGDGGKIYEMPTNPFDVNNLAVLREREGSDNIFDFKSFSPRIGLTYMLTNDGKTVLRATYGRYYAPISVENLGNAGPDMEPYQEHFNFFTVPFNDLNGDGLIFGDDVIAAIRLLHGASPDYGYTNDINPAFGITVEDGMKNQHTDQITVSLERELFKDLSFSATYIRRKTQNIIVRWPINGVTGEPWEYERVPYTTQNGSTVDLYSVVWHDYNGDGVIDGSDVGWVGANGDFMWRNMPETEGKKAQRLYQGLQLVLNKRFSYRWQMLASVLLSSSDGFASRSKRQDINIEGPNIINDAWLGGLNQLLNNMEGPLPFTPKFEFKLSGSYRLPSIEVDLGFRFRYHSGRALWPLEAIPVRASWGGAPNSIISTGGNNIVAIDPNDPDYLPGQKVLDLHLEKGFKLGQGRLNVSLDLFNVFNDGSATNALWTADYGRVTGVTFPSRKLRMSVIYQF